MQHPARRHGRLLRQRRAAGPARAHREAGHRRAFRRARRGAVGHLRGADLRGPLGHAGRPGPAAVPAGHLHPDPRHGAYGAVSREVMRHLPGRSRPRSSRCPWTRRSWTYRARGAGWARPAVIGQLIRREVAAQQAITCSVGIAVNKFVAKLASVHCKPDGLLVDPGRRRPGVPAPAAGVGAVGRRARRPARPWPGWACGRSGTSPPPRSDVLERELGRAAAAHLSALAVGPRRPAGGTVGPGEEHRRRGDLRRGHRRPRAHPPRAAAAVRPDGPGPARGRRTRPGRSW